MSKMRIAIIALLVFGLTVGLSGMAFAAAAGCGQCHGAYVNDNHGGKTLMPGVSTLEDTKTPQDADICNSTGRGLHGVHMNYSSATYGKKSTTRGNCNYCHNEHIHENGYVEMEGYAPYMALGTIASTSAVTLGSGGSGYTVGDVATINGGTNGAVTVSTVNGSGAVLTFTVSAYRESYGYSVASGIATTGGTGTGLTVNITSITNYGLRQLANSTTLVVTGTGMTANGLDITQMTGNATCTGACHKGTSATNPAPWGNVTSISMKLSCVSCHDDASNSGATLSSPSNYGHKIHLTGSWLGSGANKTRIVMGSYSGYLNAGDNSACQFCHPDNRNDLWSQGRKDDGSKKAYPHASDGTNVLSKNAAVGGQAGVVLANWTGDYMRPTCTVSCHTQTSSYQTGYAKWDGGKPASGTFSNCEICHQHKASAAINNSSNIPLTYAHSIHFFNLSTTSGLVTCGTCHASVHTNYAGVSMITRLPVTPGNAGLLPAMNWSRNGVSAVDGTCTNTCHVSASPAWNSVPTGSIVGTTGCATCHEYPGAPGRDWTTTGNGHLVRFDAPAVNTHMRASGFNYQTDTFAAVTVDSNKCGQCHKGVKHMNGSGFAHVSSVGNVQCGTGNFTVNITTPGSNTTCSNVSCHSGRTTPNWW